MKNLLIFFFVCASLLKVFAQNARDDKGKKQGHWVVKGKDKPSLGYASDKIIEEGNYVHGRKSGVWIKYHKDGHTAKLKGEYVDNRPMGQYSRYFSNGKLKEKGTFGNETYSNELIRYHKNGNIAFIAKFDDKGNETGVIKHFYPNGNLQAQFQLKNGEVDGVVSQYYENGTLKSSYNISNGKITETLQKPANKKTDNYSEPEHSDLPPKVENPITKGVTFFPEGYNKVYNENDEIWLDGNFRNGNLWDGKVFSYGEDGLLRNVKIFKEGKFHSYSQF